MNFNEHLNLKGTHAIFSASKSSWLRYDQQKMESAIRSQWRSVMGTDLHDFASSQIKLGHKITNIRNLKQSIENYIYFKYYDENYCNISEYGKKMLFHLSELDTDIFETVKLFVNDAIGYRMESEQILYYSDIFYGTTDAICFRNNFLRIHDMKTGDGKVDMEQLLIYAALFCTEYEIKPRDIESELRIYQHGEILFHKPEADEILPIMNKIISDDRYLSKHYFKENL